MMRKILLTFIFTISSLALIACSTDETYDIVATMFTHYDISTSIVEDKMSVKLLVPAGEGIHGFEASSKDMVAIENAKLFLFTSLDIDTWISDENTIGGDDTIVLNMSKTIDEDHNDEHDEAENDEVDDGHNHSEDSHYWVDPMNVVAMTNHILESIIELDPENQSFYEANANAYIDQITTISSAFETIIAERSSQATIYVAGHNAFSSFGEHFGIQIVSIFDEYEPDAVLDSSQLIPFVEAIKEAGTHYLFIDALESPTAANRIQEYLADNEDYELTILKLYAYQNVIQDDLDNNVSYSDLLQRNIDHIQLALGVTND